MPLIRPLAPGQRLGSFELMESLAEGPLATTWSAVPLDDLHHRRVALKTVAVASIEDGEIEEAFLHDTTQATAITHSTVARLLEAGRQGAYLFAAFEWVDGVPLTSLLRLAASRGGIPSEIALRILLDACDAVAAVHQTGLIHRSVRPSNVVLTPAGSLKLLDVGVSAALSRSSSSTTFRHAVGKFTYLSPEQLWSRPTDMRADVFCLGLLGYHMLAGHHPFQGANERETTSNILSPSQAPSLSELRPELPPGVCRALERALCKEPSDRTPSAISLRGELLEATSDVSRLATSDEVAALVRSWTARASSRPPPQASALPSPEIVIPPLAPLSLDAPTSPPRRPTWLIGAVVLVLAGLAGAAWAWQR